MRITLLKKIVLLLLVLLACNVSWAQSREIAITIDDLPFVGEGRNFHLNKIISSLEDNQIPATGFVIAGSINPNNWETLHKFRDAGFGLGNHTLSHLNLNKIETDAYIKEIEEADKILAPVLTEPKYFRYPYLVMGEGEKKESVLHYLRSKHYRIAPITIDSKDFLFNKELLSVPQEERFSFLEELKGRYLDFIWEQTLKAEEHNRYAHNPDQAQILLIHANLLNAYVLPELIELYREKGFRFVSLEDALKTFKKTTTPRQKKHQPDIDSAIKKYMAWD